MADGRECPGSTFGDNSVDFYRNPCKFFYSRSAKYSTTCFNCRFVLKCSTFVGSYQGVKSILEDDCFCYDMGYKDYLQEIYGDVLLFRNEEDALFLRNRFSCLFGHTDIVAIQHKIKSTVSLLINQLDPKSLSSNCLYSTFKSMAADLMISVFLDLNIESDKILIDEIKSLSVTHWHGIISVPFSLKLPTFGISSTYNKALEAKRKLTEIIRCHVTKVYDDDSQVIRTNPSILIIFQEAFKSSKNAEKEIIDHLVLFVSALGSKAMASLMTSFVLTRDDWNDALQSDGIINDEDYKCIIQEVQRLFPPFVGGRRFCKKDTVVDGFRIPKGNYVFYHTYAAQRDPTVFDDPDKFDWTRWKKCDVSDWPELFSFGFGRRSCVGKCLMQQTVKEIVLEFVHKFEYNLPVRCDEYKWLPVCRPKSKTLVRLSLRTKGQT